MRPAGTYYARFVSAVAATVENENKTPYIHFQFDVTHVATDGAWQELPQGDPAYVDLFLSEGAWPYTCEKLKSLGFNGNFEQPGFTNVDKGVVLSCTHDEYRGKTREKWDIGEGGGFQPKAMAREQAMRFSAKWRNENGASKPGGSPQAPPASGNNEDWSAQEKQIQQQDQGSPPASGGAGGDAPQDQGSPAPGVPAGY